MQAIILAAGMGSRLKKYTEDRTKCMVELNSVRLIDRMLLQLDKLGLDRIVIVVGYKGEDLVSYTKGLGLRTKLEFVNNPIYDKTNNIYSLALAKDFLLLDDSILLESDLVFDDSVLDCLLADERENLMLVAPYASWMDGTCVELASDFSISNFVPGKAVDFSRTKNLYKTVNIYKFSRSFSAKHYVPFLDAYRSSMGENVYYEQVFKLLIMVEEAKIFAKVLEPSQKWYEIDDEQDLDIASTIFEKDRYKKLQKISSRYGGYWRYPGLLDYCYLVNPFYPTERMVQEMQASFPRLLRDYPSSQRVNSLIAAKSLYLPEELVAVGNGAAELIKSALSILGGRLGIVWPTFEEYVNRMPREDIVVLIPQNQDFSYGLSEILDFLEREEPENFLLINADNPSGNYLAKAEVEVLATYCQDKGIRLILDESFVDFADEEASSHLQEDWLLVHPSCLLIKSISKSYGVAGLRLGIAASADKELIARLRADLSIWNINSIAEFYLQIMEKYKKDYEAGLLLFRKARSKMLEGLQKFSSLRATKSQANFVMLELIDGTSSLELAARLLDEDDILIKDLSPKFASEIYLREAKTDSKRQFIRLAVRTEEENQRLLAALAKYLA